MYFDRNPKRLFQIVWAMTESAIGRNILHNTFYTRTTDWGAEGDRASPKNHKVPTPQTLQPFLKKVFPTP
jgi:hypothetical protein